MILHTYMYKKVVELVYFTTRIKLVDIYYDAGTQLSESAPCIKRKAHTMRFSMICGAWNRKFDCT